MKKFDEKIDLDKVLFHGLTYYEVGNIKIKVGLQRLINIIRAGGILSRRQVYITFGEKHYNKWQKEFCRVNWNGLDNVSVCKKSSKLSKKYSEAFKLFVRNSISLILDSSLLEDLNINKSLNLEDGEFQVKNKIDFKYVIGIAVPVLNPTEVALHKKNVRNCTREQTEEWIKGYYDYCINDIFKILKHYNIELPIYSIDDGNIIKPLNDVLDEVYGKENSLNI